MRWTRRRLDDLRAALVELDRGIDRGRVLDHDPVGIVHELPPPEREVGAHLASMLAYGRVSLVRQALRDALAAMGPSPTAFARSARPGELAERLGAWRYRMTSAGDLDGVVVALGVQLRRWGTLEAAWEASTADVPGDLADRLSAWVATLRAGVPGEPSRGVRYLLADPASGSATKRWYLMLRWLVRPADGVDLGLWTVERPDALLLPLDTHTGRLTRWLGLSDRRVDDLRKAREVTALLSRLDPTDPVRFDLALCHLGIQGDCRHRWVREICDDCALRGMCQWTVGKRV